MLKKILLLAGILLAGVTARAVVIDGLTPEGTDQQVGVTDNGFLDVNLDTSSAIQVGPLPIPVQLSTVAVPGHDLNPVTVENSAGNPVPVTIQAGSANIKVSVQVATTTANNVGNGCSTGSGFPVFPADSTRYQITLVNECGTPANPCGSYMRVGPSSVSPTVGYLIPPGGNYSPDNPASFQGAEFGASTTTVCWSWTSH